MSDHSEEFVSAVERAIGVKTATPSRTRRFAEAISRFGSTRVPASRPLPTEGDWKLERDGSVAIGGQVIIGPDDARPEGRPLGEGVANCRLFAASKALLEACRSAAALLEGVAAEEECRGKRNAAMNVRETERFIAAAIARAEGGAP